MLRVGQHRKRDANEAEIVTALRQIGAKVIRISEKGAPDLLVLYQGGLFVLEVKSRRGRATVAQDATFAAGWPVYIVRDAYQALQAVQAG